MVLAEGVPEGRKFTWGQERRAPQSEVPSSCDSSLAGHVLSLESQCLPGENKKAVSWAFILRLVRELWRTEGGRFLWLRSPTAASPGCGAWRTACALTALDRTCWHRGPETLPPAQAQPALSSAARAHNRHRVRQPGGSEALSGPIATQGSFPCGPVACSRRPAARGCGRSGPPGDFSLGLTHAFPRMISSLLCPCHRGAFGVLSPRPSVSSRDRPVSSSVTAGLAWPEQWSDLGSISRRDETVFGRQSGRGQSVCPCAHS